MSLVKISEHADAPEEGTGKMIELEHTYTTIKYTLALFNAEGKYYAITDQCPKCGGSLGRGLLKGMLAVCTIEECLWNIKSGICKFDRSRSTPTYKVIEQEDGLYINI